MSALYTSIVYSGYTFSTLHILVVKCA